MFDRARIRSAIDRTNIVLREWQRGALIQATGPTAPDAGLITATMGAGKSIAIALLCAGWTGRVVVTTPTIALTEQLRGTIASVCGEAIGAYYTHDRRIERVTVCCLASAERFAEDWTAADDTLFIHDEAHNGGKGDFRIQDAWRIHSPSGAELSLLAVLVGAVRPARRVGFSATPYGSDEGQRLWLWTHEAFRYTVHEAITDGALVPMRLILPTSSELPRDKYGRVDADAWIAEHLATLPGPGVISARDIEDADTYAAELCAAGIPAESVHSRMSRKRIDAALERLRTGQIKALVHCHLLSEGVDLPWLMWLVLRHPRGSRVEFAQEIGRVLRWFLGKLFGIVVDPYGVTLEHQLQDAAAIGEATQKPQKKAEERAEEDYLIDPLTGERMQPMDDMPAAERKAFRMRSEVALYVARAVVALRGAGLIVPRAGDGSWRKGPATAKQLAFLGRFSSTTTFVLSQKGQDDHVRAVAYCVRRMGAVQGVTSGPVADCISVARVLLWGQSDGPKRGDVRREALGVLATWEVDVAALLASVSR
jgi:superfamily II DNA or RNA helicase